MKPPLSTLIDRSPDEVYSYLTDFGNQPTWKRGVVRSQQEPPGPPRVGTRIHKLRRTPLGRARVTDEIAAFDPSRRRYVERVVDGMIRGSGSRWTVGTSGQGARVDVEVIVRATGPWRLLERFIARTAERDMLADLTGLKGAIEQRAGA